MRKRPEYSLSATGENLRKLRKEKKLSVEEVRAYMGLESVQAIYGWELGYNYPTADNLLALAELYGVNPIQMLVKKNSQSFRTVKKAWILLYTQNEEYFVYY